MKTREHLLETRKIINSLTKIIQMLEMERQSRQNQYQINKLVLLLQKFKNTEEKIEQLLNRTENAKRPT